MSLETSKIQAKQEALDTSVTDLVRIVGKLDKKIDTGFTKLAADIDNLKRGSENTQQQLNNLSLQFNDLKKDSKSTQQQLDDLSQSTQQQLDDLSQSTQQQFDELRKMLVTVLSRLPS